MGWLDKLNIFTPRRLDQTGDRDVEVPGDTPVKNEVRTAIERVKNGEIEVAGRGSLVSQKGTRGRVGAVAAGANSIAAQVAGLGNAPLRPQREYYETEDAYDQAYLAYQDQHMKALRERYPDAWHKGEVMHGCDLPPEVVLKQGLRQKGEGDNFDLREHQRDFHTLDKPAAAYSALRGGCLDARIPAGLAGEGRWVYILVPRGGALALDAALGNDQVRGTQGELEHSFGARQPGCQIRGYLKVGSYSDLHDAYRLEGPIDNPDFDPA